MFAAIERRGRRSPHRIEPPSPTWFPAPAVPRQPTVLVTVADARREEEQRVAAAKAAAKAALAAKLTGYEGGFPQSADGDDGGHKSAARLADGVVSADHIPVAAEKVQAVNDAVVLLLDGQPVQSLQRGGLTFVPVQIIDGAAPAADSFQVVMEAPTLLYRTNAEARARKEQQISDANKRIADAKATLAELQEALTRSEAAFEAAVEAADAPDGDSELSDIGAMAIEKRRIITEIAKQQATLQTQQLLLQQAQSLDVDSQLTEHRITPQFKLQSGYQTISAAPGLACDASSAAVSLGAQTKQVLLVLRQSQLPAQGAVHFSHSVTADAQ